jgi:hypothetical protein|tara:strand:+ start:35625 stop:36137 length:513 start_codon:yes stop_codon:yes gene_type:complete
MIELMSLPGQWKPHTHAEKCLESVFSIWEDTPYKINAASPKKGVDCCRFIACVYLTLSGIKINDFRLRPLPRLTSKEFNWSHLAAECTLFNFGKFKQIHDFTLEPGDILFFGENLIKVNHIAMIGFQKNTLWQCTNAGVHWTGLGYRKEYSIYRIYRSTNKDNWQCQQAQ